jgi:hypothetical protein
VAKHDWSDDLGREVQGDRLSGEMEDQKSVAEVLTE